MKRKGLSGGSHMFSGLFVFLLIGLFAIASITLVLSGINVYRHVTTEAALNTEKQIALSYLGNKIHAYDGTGSVSLKTYNGIDVLCLLERFDDEAYETRIYYDDGTLWEQFVSADEAFDSQLGERLTEIESIQFKNVKPDLLQVTVVLPDGSQHTLHMALRSSQAG